MHPQQIGLSRPQCSDTALSLPLDIHNPFVTCPDPQTFTQQMLPSESSLLVFASAHDRSLKFACLSLESLVPSFLGCLRSSLTTQAFGLDLILFNIKLRKSSEGPRSWTVTLDKAVFCEMIMKSSSNLLNNLKLPKKPIDLQLGLHLRTVLASLAAQCHRDVLQS